MSNQPGESDPEVYGQQSVDDETQLQPEDTLDDRGVDDVLDEGYSPPEREPRHLQHDMTADEQRERDTIDERIVQEEPEPDPYADTTDYGEEDPRAGRLVAPDEGNGSDQEKDEVAEDVGIDGGAASAEEAAMHVVESDDGPFTEPAVDWPVEQDTGAGEPDSGR